MATDNYYGSSKATSPAERFTENLTKLSNQCLKIGNSHLEGSSRVWQLADVDGTDPANHEEVRNKFSRTAELDPLYQATYETGNPGTSSDAKVIKLQAAYLQAMERAFRVRHCSLARAEALSAGRKYDQGTSNGTLMDPKGVLGYINKLIALGAK